MSNSAKGLCPYKDKGDHGLLFGYFGALLATETEWVCPFCGYKEDFSKEYKQLDVMDLTPRGENE